VSIDNASQIFLAAKHPKSFISLDSADHLLTRPADAAFAAAMISSWASRYLSAAQHDPDHDRALGIVAEESGVGRFQQRLHAGKHTFYADEPAQLGGDDTGPTPYDFLSAALAACKSMTVRLYADRKKWPLQRISVRVRHERVHADDCATCDAEDHAAERFRAELFLAGDLSAEQRARLLEIADRCPVHRTLSNAASVETSLAEGLS